MNYRRKPAVLLDIRKEKSPFSKINNRINLKRGFVFADFPYFIKILIVSFSVFIFFFGPISEPNHFNTLIAAGSDSERQVLENQLKELELEISNYETTIEKYRSQGSTLKSEIKSLEAKMAKINLQIKATQLSLSSLDNEIKDTSNKIIVTEKNISDNTNKLSEILQNIHETDNSGLVEILLKNPKLSDFFDDVNNIIAVQNNLRITLNNIIGFREDLVNQKQNLALEREDISALKSYQDSQRLVAEKTKSEKDNLLKTTKGQESKYQELLTNTKQTAAEIRSRIFRLLGGGELSFEEAYKLAKFAEDATGIRAAFTLAVLDHESSIGKNVGSCFYKTAMHPTRDIPVFLEILKELNLSPDSVKVSCPIYSDGSYGGAMGPAQFIPSTWNLYENSIAKITGNNPPSPWRNIDAFVATALYLKDSYYSSSCRSYSQQIPSQAQVLQERCAAAQYYAGKRWYTYRFAYGDPVVNKANQFQQDINVLTS
ncbi:MAG: hypothetical protein A2430_00990 [Candidatus Liptonbacteria bacterium RIFOXYC1_FULL_36_8]|uniref:Transglycosylase SLT domain-containing protein n=3 Tax=Candidatus Liptoniibacteriota TaxID=1817909 RepID=A0A1G2CN09_9BACT|nr:MAG: hypothetical protein A2390_02690 [Candidatus Liptonbacteria bacterium RIFOXYB1_FULL_36_10]OGZ02926.1 MAG: hypothetical protein A2430_00990 [Candidatus Liptonbacteria bacterium RIFOXYC1_FULL_36_8]OGZ04080.1 MAG: hypothetical protein A2604_02145 [Candidatus Liptonbacteria bacterium RIFOXYD1_FULL_36_11]